MANPHPHPHPHQVCHPTLHTAPDLQTFLEASEQTLESWKESSKQALRVRGRGRGRGRGGGRGRGRGRVEGEGQG